MLERLSSTERAVREAGLRDLVQELARHGEHEHPLHDEVTFRRSTGRATAQQTLWKRRAISRWLGASRRDTEQALRGAVARQETVQQTIHLASESSAARAGSIDRISETESIRAYNVARERGLYVVNKHRPGLYKRWTERVDDSGRPLDNRVGLDSIALHGQLALPGEAFVMPADARVESRFMGKSWAYPPNRPYDRAVVSPWREGWGIPGWMLRDGRRVSR
jgi:hypothetical protein